MIIGENYDALKNLLAVYENKIDFIYIDPPYNTESTRTDGNSLTDIEGQNTGKFIYRDKFSRTGWLNMMNERLQLARKLLSNKGVIFISIDDNEQAYLKVLCDEVFGEENFVNNFMWLIGKGKKDKNSRTLQQYILCYAKNKELLPNWIDLKTTTGKMANPDNDARGKWFSGSISFSEERSNKNRDTYFTIQSPSGIKWTRQWMVEDKREMDELLKDNKIYFGEAPEYNKVPRLKIFETDLQEIIPDNIFSDVGTTKSAIEEIKKIFGKILFDTPKPTNLIKHLLKIASQKNSIILDFFAGSGTTGQAVMELNEEDGGKRQFILCTNNENGIAENITYERLYRVINGEGTKGEQIKWQYSKDKKSLKNNNLDVFRIAYHQLEIEDYEKGEQLVKQAKEVFRQLDDNFELKGEFDIYNKLASLKPYSEKDRAECEKGFSYQNKQAEDEENEEERD